jgi:hypothetical protein
MVGGPYIPHLFGDDVQEIYRNTRGWLTAAVHTSIAWPKNDVMVHYDGDDYFIRGIEQGGDHRASPCITMRWSEQETHTVLNKLYRFSSVLGWYKGGYVDVTGHITGSGPALYSSGKQPYGVVIAGGPNGFDCNYMPVIQDDNTRRALAFWHEGLRLARIHDGYSFLSFYKVIESQFVRGKDKGNWINEAITTLTGKAGERISELLMATKTRTYLANTHDRAGLLRMAVVHQQVSYGE